MNTTKTLLLIVGIAAIIAAIATAIAVPLTTGATPEETDLEHAKVLLKESPLVDCHNDLTSNIRIQVQNNLSSINLYDDMREQFVLSHTDIPRMRAGLMGGQFWSCYAPCNAQGKDATRRALEQLDVMYRMIDQYPNEFQSAYTADDIESAFAQGKIASLIGLEGGHIIDSSLPALRMFYRLGARYMILTHACDTPWADSSAGRSPHGGLTEFGRKVILEMNRLGMMVDVSHVSIDVMKQALGVSRAPVIFSHSSVKELCNHNRNVPDDVLKTLGENDGVIMINLYTKYITCKINATVSDVADHFDHVRNLIGSKHVGVGSDFDAAPLMPNGIADTSQYPNLFAELIRRGWSDDEVKDAAGRNIIRVMRKVEDVAAQLKEESPDESWIPGEEVDQECRSPN